MDNEEIQGVKFSEFPSQTPVNADTVVGLHSGDNARFSIANIIAAVRNGLANIFVPKTDVGATNGVASLDSTGKVPGTQLDLSGKQDTITASGILKGDGQGGVSAATPGTDYQAPLTIDATPTANSTNPVQSGGVYTDVRTRVPNYGKGVNLLRNWYFVGGGTGHGVFPVNQRGQSSYSGNIHSISGFHNDTASKLDLIQSGVQLGYTSGTFADIYQYVDGPSQLLGKKLTLSVLDSNGFHTASGTVPSSAPGSLTNIVNINDGDIFRVRISPAGNIQFVWISDTASSASTKRTVYAVKLELGSEQTLAHQENGVWVLNDIPDYEYELYRCQTSTADSSDTYANKSLATEQQLAYVETGTTASRNYAVGEKFCMAGLLYRAIQPIANGDTFTPGTNCEQTTVGDELAGRTYVLYSLSTILDVHAGNTIPISANTPSLNKYRFIVLRLTTSSSDGSSTRGVVMIPTPAIRTGPYLPAVVGGVTGWLRVSASSDYLSFIITSTSFTSLYLANIYGII